MWEKKLINIEREAPIDTLVYVSAYIVSIIPLSSASLSSEISPLLE
ncbi:hypothetical protein GMMP15_570039 [Candidatus Magnetomoraceae bacterium gMMP-15]